MGYVVGDEDPSGIVKPIDTVAITSTRCRRQVSAGANSYFITSDISDPQEWTRGGHSL